MISFSGIDCCGKSTQIDLVCKELAKRGRKTKVVWSRGGYTPGIELFKRILRGGKKATKEERLAASAKANESGKKRKLLLILSLIDLWFYYSIVLRFKGIGCEVICDRYIWDTYIDFKMKYPDSKFERGFWWRLTLKTMVKPKPSIVMFIPAEMSMYRSSLKEEPFPEPIEVRRERIEWYVREMENGRWQHKIDATGSIEEVYAEVIKACDEGKKNV